MCEIVLCELCSDEIAPNTIELYLKHLFEKHNTHIISQYQCTTCENCALYHMGFIKNKFKTISQFLIHYMSTHYTNVQEKIRRPKKLIQTL